MRYRLGEPKFNMSTQSWDSMIWGLLPKELTSVFGTKTPEGGKAHGIAVEIHSPRAILHRCVQQCSTTGSTVASKAKEVQKQVETVTKAAVAKVVSKATMGNLVAIRDGIPYGIPSYARPGIHIYIVEQIRSIVLYL